MSFAWPLVLVGLVVIPLLAAWYVRQQRGRRAAIAAFVTAPLTESVAPRRPGWRRHAPIAVFALAIALLIVAAARPQRTLAVPRKSGAIMLAQDVSSSMSATDVKPSRLDAAKQAASRFVARVPAGVKIGQIEFARHPTLLLSPTTNRTETQRVIAEIAPGGGGTAIGDTINEAVRVLSGLRQDGKRVPGAIVLLSDGASNVGSSPLLAAQRARQAHIPVYTIALGTPYGTIPVKRHGQTVTGRVPVSPSELEQIAARSGGRSFTAGDAADATAVYDHLAKQLGHKQVKREITADVAGGGLVLLLIGSALSLLWFARLA